ncbi:helix-turn-helix transcriptional regulator [Streptomyces sp. NBC_01590]|uniref:helix-turn-helix domain-containing protein n=1 Tax=Streptomyces sp. NBC_01590 TaxID=2975887 RepID=UPI00386A4077
MADRTGYSRTSWERYLNGRLFAPKGAVVALAEAMGTSQAHLTTMWELVERAWSRSEPRQDKTVLSVRIPGAGDAGDAGDAGGEGHAGGAGHAGSAEVRATRGYRPGTRSRSASAAAAHGRPCSSRVWSACCWCLPRCCCS